MKAPDHTVSKQEAAFERPAKGMHHCSECWYYYRHTCDIVRGRIEPGDWCKYWRQKTRVNLLGDREA